MATGVRGQRGAGRRAGAPEFAWATRPPKSARARRSRSAIGDREEPAPARPLARPPEIERRQPTSCADARQLQTTRRPLGHAAAGHNAPNPRHRCRPSPSPPAVAPPCVAKHSTPPFCRRRARQAARRPSSPPWRRCGWQGTPVKNLLYQKKSSWRP